MYKLNALPNRSTKFNSSTNAEMWNVCPTCSNIYILSAAVKFNFMSEEQFLEMFTNAVKSEKIRIIVDVTPQQAQAGSGQWNITNTIVIVNDEQVAKFEGSCELCEPR